MEDILVVGKKMTRQCWKMAIYQSRKFLVISLFLVAPFYYSLGAPCFVRALSAELLG